MEYEVSPLKAITATTASGKSPQGTTVYELNVCSKSSYMGLIGVRLGLTKIFHTTHLSVHNKAFIFDIGYASPENGLCQTVA